MDSGRWRLLGITHWDLVRSDWLIERRAERFAQGLSARERAAGPTDGIARSPAEVVAAIRSIRAAVIGTDAHHADIDPARDMLSFWSAMNGRDVRTLQRFRDHIHIAHITAYAKTREEGHEQYNVSEDEIAYLADGPWKSHTFWRSDLEAMQAANRQILGYPESHPAAVLRRYRPTDEIDPRPVRKGLEGERSWTADRLASLEVVRWWRYME